MCGVLSYPCSRLQPGRQRQTDQVGPVLDELLVERIRRLIARFPSFGYRKLWAMLRFRQGITINR